jgi:16S rRNA (guanine(966)-N(2))-methyltransferase RsmD
MRIIAGTFRSRQLKSLKKLAICPTSDMLRETLFNILGPRVAGSRFLDLFAGTGAVGIEAISRGAAFVALVENYKPAVRLIGENLASLRISQGVHVFSADALAAIAKLNAEHAAPFDFVFLDPPYANEPDYQSTFRALEKSALLEESGMVIAEHHKSFSLPATFGRLEKFRTLKQGDAALSFYSVRRPSA